MIPERNDLQEAIRVRPEDLVKGSIRLLGLPEVFVKLTRMTEDPRSSGAAIARTIARDPALTARLLRLANSPFYGFPSRIDTIERALTVIGTRALRDLVLATSVVEVFSRMPIMEMRTFWRHSLLSGVAARLIGIRCGSSEPEALFLSGLLHDVGQLIILAKLPEMGRETRQRAHDCGLPLHAVEKAVIGFDHAEVGGELLRQWRLPPAIREAVMGHHLPPGAARTPLSSVIIQVADILAHELLETPAAEDGALFASIVEEHGATTMELLRLDADSLPVLRAALLSQTDSLGEILLDAA